MKTALQILVVNLLALFLIEGAFRVARLSPSAEFFIPGKEKGVLVSNRAFYDPTQVGAFNDVAFQREKSPGTVRIFILGESTAAGLPFNPHATIARWLQAMLKDVRPDVQFEVVNAGMAGAGAKRILNVQREILHYAPDLIVVYSGQNEFLEHNVKDYRDENKFGTRLKSVLFRSAFCNWLRWQAKKSANRPFRLYERPNFTIADATYVGGDFDGIVQRYRQNLHRLAREAKEAHVPLIFMTPFSNLKDWEPNGSYSTKHLNPEQKEAIIKGVLSAKKTIDENRPAEAAAFLQSADRIDSEIAEVQWQKGRYLWALGKWEESREAFARAAALDYVPWRNLSFFPEMIQEISLEHQAYIFDARRLLESHSPHGLLGETLIVDNCHPTLHAQYILAQGLMETLSQTEIFGANTRWQWPALRPETEYLNGFFPSQEVLAETYFRAGRSILYWVHLRYDSKDRLKKAIGWVENSLQINPRNPEAQKLLSEITTALEVEEGTALESGMPPAPGQKPASPLTIVRHDKYKF